MHAQQAALLSALPFAVIVSLLGISLVKELHRDPHYQALHPHAPELAAVPGPVVEPDESDERTAVEGQTADTAAELVQPRQPVR